MKSNNKKTIAYFLLICFFVRNTLTHAVQTSNEYNHSCSPAIVDYREEVLRKPLFFLNQCKQKTNQELVVAPQNKEKLSETTLLKDFTKTSSFCDALTISFLYFAMVGQGEKYLDLLTIISQVKNPDTLSHLLQKNNKFLMVDMILAFHPEEKTSSFYKKKVVI